MNSYGQGQIGNLQLTTAQQQAHAQASRAYNAAMKQHQHHWMIDGRTMTFQQFLDEIAPGDDNPMRTFLTLKYGGWNE
jgi:hypothetical protein